MDEKLRAELETLKKNLEGKTSKEIKEAIEAFETKADAEIKARVKILVGDEVKTVKEQFELDMKTAKEELEAQYKADIKVVQDHANKLDLKLQKGGKVQSKTPSFEDGLKKSFEDNFDSIKAVRKGNSAKIEVKAVADMTLGAHLTGDQPRDYSNTVVMTPSPLVNFADIIGPAITISGGTYTFPRETTSEGSISVQTEGALKSQIDYDLVMVDVNTDFLAGFAVYSKKMANNLPFLQSFIPQALRRDYLKAENSLFNTTLAAASLASTELITNQNKVEMLIAEIARLEALDNPVNGIVVRPSDWYDIAVTEKSSGAGYGLPGIVTYSAGQLAVNGIPVFKANWLASNKYYVGDWSRVKKVVTEGLSLEFSNEDVDNFRKNNITAKIEAQIGLAYERTNAIIYGDFTAS